jgi:MinD superfamily P-loop ATPase
MDGRLKIAVAGNKGGVGKTFVAINLFQTVNANMEEGCTLADAHIQVPGLYHFFKELPARTSYMVDVRIPEIDQNACTFCGRCVHYCAFDAILMIKEAGHIKVMDDYCTSCGACVYACNDGAISERGEHLGRVSDYQLPHGRFLEGRMFAIRPLASPVIIKLNELLPEKGLIIVDTPPGNSYPFAESVRDADFVVLVTEPGFGGMENLKKDADILLRMNLKFGVVINKSIGDTSGIKAYLQQQNIPLLAEIPFNRNYAELHSRAEIVVRKDADLHQKFEELYRKIQQNRKGGDA